MKKILRISLIVLASLGGMAAIAVGVLAFLMSRPLNRQDMEKFLHTEIVKLRAKPQLQAASLSLVSRSENLQLSFEADNSDESTFHSASVGKLFTTVLVAKKVEEGSIDWDTPVSSLLDSALLQGLVDPADLPGITIADLLGHTSGMADYFDGRRNDGGPTLASLMIEEPQRFWPPEGLLDHSRRYQSPGRRGSYLYSDSGFIVLGLVIEALYGQPFTTAVHQHIFDRLGMNDSYYPTRSSPKNQPIKPLLPSWLEGANLADSQSLSADWSGGGVASTHADLQRFAAALLDNSLISRNTLDFLSQKRNSFIHGVQYGLGIMTIEFGAFMPLLAKLPAMTGHMGILGTQLFIEPETGTSIVINLGASGHMEDSVRLLISAASALARLQD
ncbi:MAG: beta-lactamase family protein [Spirochaetes bacterium]|nr:beta-lactamase family protein [Spirochaetota bacterium]